jgi:hypothetical protein
MSTKRSCLLTSAVWLGLTLQRMMETWTVWLCGTLCAVSPAWAAEGNSALPSAISPATIPDQVFASTSFWYTPIPADAPLHPNSTNLVAEFLRQKNTYYGNVNINTVAYAFPVYVADANTPTVPVTVWDCQNKQHTNANLAEQWAAVPIPAYAEPADGTDALMAIYQPSADSIWEFWKATKVDGRWMACWGGRLQKASQSQGVWPKPYGDSASGLVTMGGWITPKELQRGQINHVIGIALVQPEHFTIHSWPATRSDGWNPQHAPNRIPEGLRFRLDPAVEVETLPMHPVGKIIAKAAQKYGFVVWDRAGAITLRAESSKSYTQLGLPDPYLALFNGTPRSAILNHFPWEKLRFLPMDYGKPAENTN